MKLLFKDKANNDHSAGLKWLSGVMLHSCLGIQIDRCFVFMETSKYLENLKIEKELKAVESLIK